MDPAPNADITNLLLAIREEPSRSTELADRLYHRAYPHLYDIARRAMSTERSDHTLQPTALVNEAFLQLVDQKCTDWRSRSHFLSIAARIMRRILVDYARARGRAKRGGNWQRVTLHDELSKAELSPLDVLALDDTLNRLALLHERMARVVELRVFAGMTMTEVAHVLDVSKRTADGDWSFARRWLARELAGEPGGLA